MTIRTALLACALLFATLPLRAQTPNHLTPAEKAAGWQLLFDGTHDLHRLA